LFCFTYNLGLVGQNFVHKGTSTKNNIKAITLLDEYFNSTITAYTICPHSLREYLPSDNSKDWITGQSNHTKRDQYYAQKVSSKL
jgi:hypothetical protein